MQQKAPSSVIIAGGKSKRLLQLAQNEPKHVLPIMNVPLINYHIKKLQPYGLIRFSYSVYNKDFFDYYFLNSSDALYSSLECHLDSTLKGPIYPIVELLEYAKKLYDDTDKIGITGDMFGHFDIDEILHHHKKYKRPITIVMARSYPSPRAGIFSIDEESSLITGFHRIESISSSTDLINLGLYIASPSLLDVIGPDLCSYKEDDIFKILIEKKAATAYILNEGNNVNINTPYQFLCANLGELLRICKKPSFFYIPKGNELDIPNRILFGKDSTVERSASIRNTIIGDGVEVGENVILNNVVLLSGAKVEYGSHLENTVVGKKAIVRKGTHINNAVITGDNHCKPMEIYYHFG